MTLLSCCAASGFGIGILYVTEEERTPGLQVRSLDSEVERLSIEMAVRRGTHLPEYVEDFRNIVRRCFGSKVVAQRGESAS